VTTTDQRLRQAADTIRNWVAEDPGQPWAPGAVAAFGPALAAVFDKWARMGELDPDLLHRVGGPETVALADLILGTPAGVSDAE
jgi:hypothetical protein